MSYESTPSLESAVWVKFGETSSYQNNDALHEAILDNDERQTESLLRKGVNASAKDADGHTPLHHAIQLQNTQIVQLLLGAGANPRTKDKNGNCPLHLAARLGDLEIIELLCKEGADLTAVDNRGKTPLHTAVRSGKIQAIYLLLSLGSNPMDEDEHGKTPLHGAAWKGQEEVLEQLVNKGGDPAAKDEFGWTPLHFAAQNGREKCVGFLAKRCDPSSQNNKGLTPLHYAGWKGHIKVVQMLAENGVDLVSLDKDGKSPLHYAAATGQVECVNFFLERKVPPNQEDNNGMTPLLLAMNDYQKDCVKILLEACPRTQGVKIEEKYCISYIEKIRKAGDFPLLDKVMDATLFRIAIDAISSGNLVITRAQKITDVLLASLPWEGIAPFLLSVSVEGNYITSLPVGLSYLNPEVTRQIDFFPDSGWRTLERFYATLLPDRIVAFSKAKREGGTVPMKAMRLMVMGGPAVGKTSLIRRLRDEGDGIPLSTDGVELGEIELEGDMVLETWDFGGQKIYRITHQLFLCDSCLYVVMFRLSDSIVLSENEIKFWIDSALSRTKKVTVLLIGTHADRLPEGVGEQRLKELHEKITEHYGSKRIYQEPGMMWATEEDMKRTFFDNFVKRKDVAAEKMKKLLVQATRSLMVRVPAPLEVVRVALAELKKEVGPITKLSVVEKMLKEVAHKHNLDSLKKNEATGLEYLEILDRLGYLLVVRPSKHTEEDFSSPSSPKARPRFSSFSSSSAVDSSFIPRKDRSHSFSAFSLSAEVEEKEEIDDIAIILEPQWIMKLLATLISTKTTFSTKGGVMKHSHLTNHLWTDHKIFPPKYHPDMVNLLIQLNIMYPFPNPKAGEISYFVPCLLEEEQPDVHHGLTSVFLNYGMEDSFYLERSIQIKKKRPVPIAVIPMVIIQLMQIGEVVECWQQGCAVVLFSPTGKVECRCILRRSTPQKIEVWMDAASLSLGGKWIKKVTRCLENMLEEFYHVDYSIEVLYRGSGRSTSCNPCIFSLDDILYNITQKKAGMYCQKSLHGVLLQHLVPDLLLHEASSSTFIPRNSLSLIKELGRGSFGRVLLCTLGGNKRVSLSVRGPLPLSSSSSSSSDLTRVAVKVLEVDASEAAKEKMIDIQKEFYLEVYTMAGLDHPNIVRLLGISDFHNPAIVLELVEGGGLLEQINSMNIPLNDTYTEIIEFIGGYRSAISLGQVHDPLPPKHLLCDGAIGKVEESFQKWLGIARSTHEEPILELKKESMEVLDAVYSCTLTAKKQGDIHDNLVAKTTNLLRETSLIYAPVPWILRLKIALEISMGLAYLHTLNPPIIHRDLKSPNIFLTTGLAQLELTDELLSKPLAKIGDFGWSVQLHGVTTHTLRGGHKSKIGLLNPMWASPEVLQEFQSYSTKADIYSLGIIMWEILVRKIPFSDDLTNLSFALRGFIIGGGRPSIPEELKLSQENENPELFEQYVSMMDECWNQEPSSRPTALVLCKKFKELIEKYAPRLYKVMDVEQKVAELIESKMTKGERQEEKEQQLRVRVGKGGESTKSVVASSFTFHSLLWRNVNKNEQAEDQIKKLDLTPSKVTYAALDWVWIGFKSGLLAALQPRICDRLILCHPQNAHSKPVSALCFQSLGGRVWSGSSDGSIHVWKADPQSRNEVLEHLQLKGWLRRVNLVFDEELWVCVENGLLRTFKDRYFGTQSECIPITSTTSIVVGKSGTSFTVHNPNSPLELKFAAPSSAKNKQSPSVEEWITTLQQLQRSQTISNSLVLLSKTGIRNKNGEGEGDVWSLEAVGRSVWCRQKFVVTEFSLKMETDEHGLHRSARIEPGRVIKIPFENMNLGPNQFATDLASFDVRNLCVAVGNALAVVPCDQQDIIWCSKEDSSPSPILCLASVWNQGGQRGGGRPEVWSYNGKDIQIWGLVERRLGLLATLPVPSDLSLSCLTQIGPNEVWAGTKWNESEESYTKGGMVVGWNISSHKPLLVPLQEEQEGNVVSLTTFSKSSVTPKERKWVAFAVSDDEALSRFVFWT